MHRAVLTPPLGSELYLCVSGLAPARSWVCLSGSPPLVSPFSVERVWNQLFLHLVKRISTSARSHCYRNSRRVPVSSRLSERMCEPWWMFAAVGGGGEGVQTRDVLAAVPSLKQLKNSRLSLLSPAPSFQQLLFFPPFQPLISRPVLLSLLFLQQRLSLAGRWSRREKVGQWVSSGNWLRLAALTVERQSSSPCTASQHTPLY